MVERSNTQSYREILLGSDTELQVSVLGALHESIIPPDGEMGDGARGGVVSPGVGVTVRVDVGVTVRVGVDVTKCVSVGV